MNYKAIIFDLDGTLLNTLGDLHASVNYALQKCGYPERTVDEVRSFIGNGVIKLIERSAPKDISKEARQVCFDIFKAHYLEHMRDSTKPFDGILQMLDELKKQGVLTAVVSNKLHSGVIGLCDEFFGNTLTCAFGVEDESERKPSAKNVFKALEALGVKPDEALYVGDSEVDVQTAINAGINCLGVTWGYRSKAELLKAGAVATVDEPFEISSQRDLPTANQ